MRKLILTIVMLLLITLPSEAEVITANIVTRVFFIKYGNNAGTAFTIEVQDRQYLITARHIVEGIKDGDEIEIRRNDVWEPISVKPLYIEPSEIDIVVLVPPFQLSPTLPLEPSADKILLSQDMYFLGFPFGFELKGAPEFQYPIPLVKKGICFGIAKPFIIIDGQGNPGFSGGPIVFMDEWTKKFKVAGVVKGTHYQEDPVFRKVCKDDKDPCEEYKLEETDMVVKADTGLVIGFTIDSAIDVISKNPIGPKVKK